MPKTLERIRKPEHEFIACLLTVDKKCRFGAARIGWARFPVAVRNEERDGFFAR